MFTLQNTFIAELKVSLLNSPGFMYGLHIVPDTRVFIFTSAPQYFEIDFVEQHNAGSTVFVVPPTHSYRLYPGSPQSFACVDIPGKALSTEDWQKIYSLKYRPQKSLPVKVSGHDVFCMLLPDNCDSREYACFEFMRAMGDQIDAATWGKSYYGGYQTLAAQLLQFLDTTDVRLDNCNIEYVSEHIQTSPRMLHRACMSVFGVPAKSVLQHHMLMKAIRLFGHHRLSVTMISDRLGFSSVAAFDKYVKRITGLTPSRLRECMLRKGL